METIHRLASPDPASMVAVEAAGAGVYVPVLQRALAKDPDRRYASAEAFAAALVAARVASPPPLPGDMDATRIARAPEAAAPEPSTGVGTGRWDPRVLARVERALAQYVGPMARLVVAQAARESATADELYAALARSLHTTADRSAFLRALGTGRAEPTLGSRTASGGTDTGGMGTGPGTGTGSGTATGAGLIPADALAAAQALLAQYVGPMARVLARQAAQAAVSPQDFFDRLCATLTKPEESTALRRRLRTDVEPKLRGP
jgi:serine/threonine-protein kinase